MNNIDILKGKATLGTGVTGDAIANTYNGSGKSGFYTVACFHKTDGAFYFIVTDNRTGKEVKMKEEYILIMLNASFCRIRSASESFQPDYWD